MASRVWPPHPLLDHLVPRSLVPLSFFSLGVWIFPLTSTPAVLRPHARLSGPNCASGRSFPLGKNLSQRQTRFAVSTSSRHSTITAPASATSPLPKLQKLAARTLSSAAKLMHPTRLTPWISTSSSMTPRLIFLCSLIALAWAGDASLGASFWHAATQSGRQQASLPLQATHFASAAPLSSSSREFLQTWSRLLAGGPQTLSYATGAHSSCSLRCMPNSSPPAPRSPLSWVGLGVSRFAFAARGFAFLLGWSAPPQRSGTLHPLTVPMLGSCADSHLLGTVWSPPTRRGLTPPLLLSKTD